jgi:hypothetical protein
MPPEFHSTRRCPPWLPPSESPERGTVYPPSTLMDNTAKYREQDELSLRSATLNLCLNVRLNRLIYQRLRHACARALHLALAKVSATS